ncbi:hypothetical protein OAJ82_01145 [Alphaproteobacteria bacterium]|nr:hypothetical protein [Alphaproteobacteria bacterium]
MKKLLIFIIFIIILLIGAYFYIQNLGNQKAQSALNTLAELALENNTKLSYKNYKINVFDQSLTLNNLKFKNTNDDSYITFKSLLINQKNNLISINSKDEIKFKYNKSLGSIKDLSIVNLNFSNIKDNDIAKSLINLLVDSININDLEFIEDTDIKTTIENISITNSNKENIENIKIQFLNISSNVNNASVNKIIIDGLNKNFLIDILEISQERSSFDSLLNEFAKTKKIQFDNFVYSVEGIEGKIENLTFIQKGNVFKLADGLNQQTLKISNASIPPILFDSIPAEMANFYLPYIDTNQLEFNTFSDVKMNKEANEYELEVSFGVSNVGETKLKLLADLNSINLNEFRQQINESLEFQDYGNVLDESLNFYTNGKFKKFSYYYKDDQLAGKILDTISGGDREGMANMASMMYGNIFGNNQNLNAQLEDAISNFIINNNELSVSIEARNDYFTLNDLIQYYQIGDLDSLVNISITGN